MDEEKRNKVTAAVVVNAILLVFIIVAVLIAQVVQISVLKRRKNQLISEYTALVAEYNRTEEFISEYEKYEKRAAIDDLIRELYKAGMSEEEIKNLLVSSEN